MLDFMGKLHAEKNTSPFATALAEWFRAAARDLPWRRTRDPYRIWLSEIILQQTRVEQGLPYYEKFVERYPTVKHLALAPDDEIFRLWEGLGYYRRAQNMLRAARIVVEKYAGRFPSSYDELLKLPGIGPYTAAAVASFAFDEAVAVVDGNVARVLARFSGYAGAINTGSGPKDLQALADRFLDRRHPGRHNQAVMELGALICTPRNPRCEICPLKTGCRAYAEGRTGELPVKKAARPVQNRRMDYLLSIKDGRLSVQKRTANDIWQNLYQFPLLEGLPESRQQAARRLQMEFGLKKIPVWAGEATHLLTHRRLLLRFWMTAEKLDGYEYVPLDRLEGLSFPIVLRRFLAGKKISPNFEF